MAFYSRQFSDRQTRAQIAFDIAFGAVLPLLFMWLDRAWDPAREDGVIAGRLYVLPLLCGSSATMLLWLAIGVQGHWTQALFAGVFGAAAFISLGVGLLLLPYTCMGLLLVLGLMGVTPFVTTWCYYRMTWRAMSRACEDLRWPPVMTTAALTGIVVMGGTAAVGRLAKGVANHHVDVVLEYREGDPDRSVIVLAVLYRFPGVPLDRLAAGYRGRERGAERKRLADRIYRIVGRSVHAWPPTNRS